MSYIFLSCFIFWQSHQLKIYHITTETSYVTFFDIKAFTFSDAYRLIDSLDTSHEEYESLLQEIGVAAYIAEAHQKWRFITSWYTLPPEHPTRSGLYTWNQTESDIIDAYKSRIITIQTHLGMTLKDFGIDAVQFYSFGIPRIDI